MLVGRRKLIQNYLEVAACALQAATGYDVQPGQASRELIQQFRACQQNTYSLQHKKFLSLSRFTKQLHTAVSEQNSANKINFQFEALHPALRPELISQGRILEIRKDNQNQLVVVVEQQGPKTWIAVDKDDEPLVVFYNQILLVLPGSSCTSADLNKLSSAAEGTDLNQIQQVWDSFRQQTQEVGQSFSLVDMTKQIFEEVTQESLYVTYKMLERDGLYFKQTHRIPPTYQPRSLEDIAIIRDVRQQEQTIENELEIFKLKMQFALDAPSDGKPTKQDWKDWGLEDQIRNLELFALCKATPEICLKLLKQIEYEVSPAGATECLQTIGLWPQHVQLPILRLDLNAPFPGNVEQAAEQVNRSPRADLERPIRVDLTHHRVITIDDASTTEVDDGLSVETMPDGRKKFWVHIADPTRFLEPNNVLDVVARDRSKTIYTPGGKIPMFPLTVAEGIFSLNFEAKCNAFSIGIVMGEDGSAQEYEFHPSEIIPSVKLTYDETDELLNSEGECEYPELLLMFEAAQKRSRYRVQQGAIEILLPECDPVIADGESQNDKTIEMKVFKMQQSRKLVAEMMIMAGEVTGRFGSENGIPLPYRGQMQPVFPQDFVMGELPEGPCRESAKRSSMTRSIFSPSEPVRHASLGLDHYVQVSSPIRRYGDILTHFQIKAFLSGRQLPFSVPEVQSIMECVNNKTRDLMKVESECRKFWVAEFFRQNRDKEFQALMCRWIRQEFGLIQALIEDIGLEVVAKINRPVVEGEYLTLRVSNVKVVDGLFRLEEPSKDGKGLSGEASFADEDVGLEGSYVDVVSINDPHNY